MRLNAQRGRLLPPFVRTLLALGVLAAPALGGVLPEDEADIMYHNTANMEWVRTLAC